MCDWGGGGGGGGGGVGCTNAIHVKLINENDKGQPNSPPSRLDVLATTTLNGVGLIVFKDMESLLPTDTWGGG